MELDQEVAALAIVTLAAASILPSLATTPVRALRRAIARRFLQSGRVKWALRLVPRTSRGRVCDGH